MKTLTTFFLTFCIVACNSNSNSEQCCKYSGVDYIFLGHFQNCIEMVTQYKLGNEAVTDEYFLQALNCLTAITDLENHVNYGDMLIYPHEGYLKDLKAWSIWYAVNKHEFTFDDAYKKFELYRKKHEKDIIWPPLMLNLAAMPE